VFLLGLWEDFDIHCEDCHFILGSSVNLGVITCRIFFKKFLSSAWRRSFCQMATHTAFLIVSSCGMNFAVT
jgi:hypothetical protein